MPIKVFISHSSSDHDLVSAFVKALQEAVTLQDGDIRCTSLPGYRLRTGIGLSSTLRKELAEAQFVIGILTPESLESGSVMFELGAGWGMEKWVVPVVAGVEYEDLPGPLKERSAADATNHAELEQLFQEMAEGLALKMRPASRATEAINAVVEEAEAYFEEEEEYEEDEEEEGEEDEEEEDEEDEEEDDEEGEDEE
jgi:hypothetical protein